MSKSKRKIVVWVIGTLLTALVAHMIGILKGIGVIVAIASAICGMFGGALYIIALGVTVSNQYIEDGKVSYGEAHNNVLSCASELAGVIKEMICE